MRRSLIAQLPEEIRVWLETTLRESGFAGYETITDSLNERLERDGYEVKVSKTSVHRFGRKFEESLEAFRASTDMAKMLQREFGSDDEGVVNDVVQRLFQNKLFTIILDDEELDPKVIAQLSRAVADLGRAAVAQKKHQIAERQRVQQRLEALEREASSTSGGKRRLDPETLRYVREELYGLPAAEPA